ncbi:MAG: DHH family phosphoesterase [Oscillospiraceae bacterium]|nr:DHH family phosphoesterase [Oscillospiraceae bacterium]
MTNHLSLQQTADFLQQRDRYLILSHRRPDGDAVGSCVGLCRALRAMGKEAWIYPNPQFTPRFATYLEGLLWGASASGAAESLTVISCDIATPGLFPFGMEEAQVELAIDHHGTNSGFAARTLVNPNAAACGELVTELIPLLGVEMDRSMAEALYVAVSTDTGCFRYSNVTAATFRAAACCLEAGAQVYPINRSFFEVKRRPRLTLEAWLVEHMEFFAGGRVALSVIEASLMERLGLTEDDIDDISGFGRTIEGVEISILLREVEQGTGKVSVRSSPAYSAANICKRLGGGGHPGAAGASLPGGIPAIREAVLASVAEEIEL